MASDERFSLAPFRKRAPRHSYRYDQWKNLQRPGSDEDYLREAQPQILAMRSTWSGSLIHS